MRGRKRSRHRLQNIVLSRHLERGLAWATHVKRSRVPTKHAAYLQIKENDTINDGFSAANVVPLMNPERPAKNVSPLGMRVSFMPPVLVRFLHAFPDFGHHPSAPAASPMPKTRTIPTNQRHEHDTNIHISDIKVALQETNKKWGLNTTSRQSSLAQMNRERLENQASSLGIVEGLRPQTWSCEQGGIHESSARVLLLQVPGAIKSEQAALALQ